LKFVVARKLKSIMKTIVSITLALLFCLGINAQTSLTKNQFDCGDPNVESQIIPEYKGKVIKIIDGNTVIVSISYDSQNSSRRNKKIRVDLAGIDTSDNDAEAKKILSDKVLNQKVLLQGNTKKKEFMFGIISTLDSDGIGEVNRHFLEKGIAKYKEPGYEYSSSSYVLCVYTKIEEKAKQEKLGIWAK
jgi:endonuclease YncB( thermonuclease family)